MLSPVSWALLGQELEKTVSSARQSPNFWTALPTILWVAFSLVVLLLFRSKLQDLITSLIWRVRCGTPFKVGSFEVGQAYVSPSGDISRAAGHIVSRADGASVRANNRQTYYDLNRCIFLVHKLAISKESGQLYDIEIYLIPHKDATLACVSRSEFYFGPYWGNKIFTSRDRARGFSISTSAYGPFVATAEIFFTDGTSTILSRYIDFEMGPGGSQPLVLKDTSPAV